MSERTVATPHGPARVHLHGVDRPRGALILGHGAGGGVGARDLIAARDAALAARFSVTLVEQPYRVAGRRSPAPAKQLDAAWIAVVEYLSAQQLTRQRLIVGGRSAGARVACRTAEQTGAIAVLCLAFPLQPPRRRGAEPAPSRLPELEQLTVPALIVQGSRDPFVVPPEGKLRTVAQVAGDHSLRTDPEAVSDAVSAWLETVVHPAATAARSRAKAPRRAAGSRTASTQARSPRGPRT